MRGVACLSLSAAFLLLTGTCMVEARGNERNEGGRRMKGRVEARGGGMESIYREQSTSRAEQLVRVSPGLRDKVGVRAPVYVIHFKPGACRQQHTLLYSTPAQLM